MSAKSPNPVDKHVGQRVRMRRMMLNMSQETLGDGLSITFQQVQKYEKGTNRISASKLQALSGLLQVPPAYFFEGLATYSKPNGGSEPTPDYAKSFLASRDGLTIAKAFMSIKSHQLRRKIADLIESIMSSETEEK